MEDTIKKLEKALHAMLDKIAGAPSAAEAKAYSEAAHVLSVTITALKSAL